MMNLRRFLHFCLIAGFVSGMFGLDHTLDHTLGHTRLWAAPGQQLDPAAQSLLIPLTGIQQVVVGDVHTCVLTVSGGVKCWGGNLVGQVGDGTDGNSHLTPVDVSGLTSGVTAIAGGGGHTCALTSGGGVKCWGLNHQGQIGNGTIGTNSLTPVDVSGLTSGVATIIAASGHTCALTTSGGVKCWGNNDYGQLGDNTQGTNRLTPVNVFGLTSGVKAVVAGSLHTCALTTDGGVKCWGYNGHGEIGDGTQGTDRLTPTNVSGLTTGVSAIAAGNTHNCALLTNGAVQCWGQNNHGQIGDDTQGTDRLTPVDVVGLSTGVKAIAAGRYRTCALTVGGGVKCWGENEYGALGDGTEGTDRLTPVAAVGLTSGISAIDMHFGHNCAVTLEQGVKCWGYNARGQLGDSTNATRYLAGDVLVPATCYTLTLNHSGDGATPAPTPDHSPSCPPGHFLQGTMIAVVAAPGADRYVQSWSGTNNNQSRDPSNLITMPDADHAASVTYGVCRTLSREHTGEGADPVAVPGQSSGCGGGKYAAGEIVTLIAAPGDGQRVQAWSGATQTPGAGDVVNSLTVPDENSTISVAYEPCVTLTATVNGEGEPLQATPTATFGCDPSSYIAGQTVTLLAAPAAGWRVAGWSGTANDAATSTTNALVINEDGASVSVTYQAIEQETTLPLFLPNIHGHE